MQLYTLNTVLSFLTRFIGQTGFDSGVGAESFFLKMQVVQSLNIYSIKGKSHQFYKFYLGWLGCIQWAILVCHPRF